jgi:hypothetical protein
MGYPIGPKSDRSDIEFRTDDPDDALSLVRYVVEKHRGLKDYRIDLLVLESLDHRARSIELLHQDVVRAQVIGGDGIRHCGNPLPSQIIRPGD